TRAVCRPIAAGDGKCRIVGHAYVAGYGHIDSSISVDDTTLAIVDKGGQRVCTNVSCSYLDRSVLTHRSPCVSDFEVGAAASGDGFGFLQANISSGIDFSPTV